MSTSFPRRTVPATLPLPIARDNGASLSPGGGPTPLSLGSWYRPASTRTRLSGEDARPVVLDADDCPGVRVRALQGELCAARVVELALVIVVAHQQLEERLVLLPREIQHRDVAVGVARSQQRSSPDAAPDTDWLLWPVVEIVGFRLVGDRPAGFVSYVIKRRGTADHALAGDPVDLVADRAHEVSPSTGGDVVGEPIRIEVCQQFDHRGVRTLHIGAAECRMLGHAQERGRPVLELLHGYSGERGEHTAQQGAHIRLVAGVMLADDLAKPRIVALIGSLPWLAPP